MKKYLIFFIIVLLNGCNNPYDYSINILECDNVTFSALPAEVKDFFYSLKNKSVSIRYGEKVINLDSIGEYQFETIQTKIGPWIDYYKLIDKTKNISYRINYNIPKPIIIFDRKLFISQGYNMLSVGLMNDLDCLEFYEYSLK